MTRLKDSEKTDLHRLASRLGSCDVTLRPTGDHISVTVRATLSPQSFESGDYFVQIGFRRCGLRFAHEGFDIAAKYSAVVGDDFWKSKTKATSEANSGLEGEAGGSFKFWNFLRIGGKWFARKHHSGSDTQEGKSVLPLIEATSDGWSLGGEAGDPRVAAQAAEKAMSGCLRGEYFSGRDGEQSDGTLKKDAPTCVLRPRADRGKANQIKATLYGVAGGLVISIARKDGASPERRKNDEDRIETFKQTLIRICLDKANPEARAATLSGEIVLHEVTRAAPKVSPRAEKSP
jgi:hypothetical protein